ncbi:unnamed protein product [Ixodes hexagonus]
MASKDAPVPALAAASLRSPPPFSFDDTGEWLAWLQQFEDYAFATGVHMAPDETRVRTPLYCMGPRGRLLWSVWTALYAEVTRRFTSYFVHPISEVYESSRFHKRTQQPGETVDGFFTAFETWYGSATIRLPPLKTVLFATVSSWDWRILVSRTSCAAPRASPWTTHSFWLVNTRTPNASGNTSPSQLINQRRQRTWTRRLHVSPRSAHADGTLGHVTAPKVLEPATATFERVRRAARAVGSATSAVTQFADGRTAQQRRRSVTSARNEATSLQYVAPRSTSDPWNSTPLRR